MTLIDRFRAVATVLLLLCHLVYVNERNLKNRHHCGWRFQGLALPYVTSIATVLLLLVLRHLQTCIVAGGAASWIWGLALPSMTLVATMLLLL